ncbi:hypothetical protein Tco_0013161 [Tanacetum coccineum]
MNHMICKMNVNIFVVNVEVHTTDSNVHNYGAITMSLFANIGRDNIWIYQCTQPSEEIDKIIQRTQERGIEICRQNEELNRVHEETMQMLRELIKVQDEKRIAKEKEAAELEAKRKSQECLNIEEKSIPQASIRSRKSRIDPTLRNFTISTKCIPFSTVKTVNSLKMGDKHLDTQKGSLESSVKDPIPIPRESDVIFDDDCDDDYQKRFDLKDSQLWMPSII